MKIYFVRHGHPNYKDDCLTELGHLQAKAAATRLADCGIERIFSSTCGRALETAAHTAERLGLPVEPCDFIREISCKPREGEVIPRNGHVWDLTFERVAEGKDIDCQGWRELEPFCRTILGERVQIVIDGLDAWLQTLGYTREGDYYRVSGTDTDHTVAMFSHGGASTVVFSHLFKIPFLRACCTFDINHTSVSVVTLGNEHGRLVMPRMELMGDAEHIKDLRADHFYGM